MFVWGLSSERYRRGINNLALFLLHDKGKKCILIFPVFQEWLSKLFSSILSHFQQTSNCEQRIVKTVLERNQHSSTKPSCNCTSWPLYKTSIFQMVQLSKALCINHILRVIAHKKTDLITHGLALTLCEFGIWHLPWFLPGVVLHPSIKLNMGMHKNVNVKK